MKFLRKHSITLAASTLLMAAASNSFAVDIKAQGFGNLYYGQAVTNDLLPTDFTNTEPNFTRFSLVGGDVTATLNENWSAFAQVIGTGQDSRQDDYKVYVEWAYVNWTPVEGLEIKVGRQRYPLWIGSAYLNQHFMLPYRVMPEAIFSLSPFASFDGASIGKTFEFSEDLKLNAEVFGGTPLLSDDVNTSVANFEGKRLIGGLLALIGDGWRIRATVSRNEESITWGTGYSTIFGSTNKANPTYLTAGYRFDKYNLVSWGEFGYAFANDGNRVPLYGDNFIENSRGGYVLIGYRIDDFLPRYTFTRSSQNIGISRGTLTTHTIGLNYQASKNVIVKGEWEIDVVPAPGEGPSFTVTQPTTTTTTTGHAFYLGADFMF